MFNSNTKMYFGFPLSKATQARPFIIQICTIIGHENLKFKEAHPIINKDFKAQYRELEVCCECCEMLRNVSNFAKCCKMLQMLRKLGILQNIVKCCEMLQRLWRLRKLQKLRKFQKSGNVRKLWKKSTSRMKLEKALNDEYGSFWN